MDNTWLSTIYTHAGEFSSIEFFFSVSRAFLIMQISHGNVTGLHVVPRYINDSGDFTCDYDPTTGDLPYPQYQSYTCPSKVSPRAARIPIHLVLQSMTELPCSPHCCSFFRRPLYRVFLSLLFRSPFFPLSRPTLQVAA